jgi:hypothetical protein
LVLDFFTTKRQALGFLWAWGVLNTLIGVLFGRHRNPVLRNLAIQSAVWGVIDAVLAFAGRRDAAAAPARGDDPRSAARRDRTILLVNAGLDIGYILGGVWLVRSANRRPDRVGMGLGFIIQGIFLFGLDSLLGWLFGRWTR